MTYQERKSITNIVSSAIITGIYAFIMYQRFTDGLLDDSNIFRMWATIILIFIPITIVAKIVIMIIYHVMESIVQAAQGNEVSEVIEIVDERDKLIELKSNTVSMFIFALSFILGLVTQMFDASGHVFFIVLAGGGFLSDIASELLKIRYYRKGV